MAPLMNSNTSTLVLHPSSQAEEPKKENMLSIFDSNMIQKQVNIPKEFIWPSIDLVNTTQEELKEPLIDLSIMKGGDQKAIASAAELVRKACLNHGFFQVINHGVEQDLINDAYCEVDSIFKQPISKKLSAKRVAGGISGYSGAHADRYSSKLPWKETFSFVYNHHQNSSNPQIVNYFKSVLGEEFQNTG